MDGEVVLVHDVDERGEVVAGDAEQGVAVAPQEGEAVGDRVPLEGDEARRLQGQPQPVVAHPHGLVPLAPEPGQLQLGADPGHQLPGRERLHDVVVGARLEAGDGGVVAGPGREEDDGQVPQAGVVPDLLEEGEPVDLGHHHVGHHQVREAGRRQPGPGLDPVGGHVDPPVATEQPAEVGAQVGVVVDHQDAAPGNRRHRLPVGPAVVGGGVGRPAEGLVGVRPGQVEAIGPGVGGWGRGRGRRARRPAGPAAPTR